MLARKGHCVDKRVQYVEARSQAHIKSSLPYDFPLEFYREGTILPVSVGAGLLPLRQGYCARRFAGHGCCLASRRHCPGPGFTGAAACVFTGCHLRFYRARRLRSNTRPPAIAATAPSPSARFAPVRGNCSPAMGSRVPSGAGAMLGLPGWPGAVVGCPGVDDAVGPAVGCGEVVGWPGVVGVSVGAAVGAGEGWPVGAAVGLAVGVPVGLTVG